MFVGSVCFAVRLLERCQGKPYAPVWSGFVFGWRSPGVNPLGSFTLKKILLYIGSSNGRRHLVHARQGNPYDPVWSGFVFGWRA